MPEKVLVVDDDVGTVKTLESILTAQGYDFESAYDGLDALAKIKESDPDVIILDVVMPEINGYDVCCELRFNSEFKKIPILLLTSTEQEIEDELGKRVNIEYLQKPINTEELFKKINLLLKK